MDKTNKQKHFPADSKATTETRALYSKILLNMDRGIMLGQQNALAYGSDWFGDIGRSDVKSICGDHPALLGWDVGGVETGSNVNIDSLSFDAVRSYILEAHNMGAISSICWQADNPITDENVENSSEKKTVHLILSSPTVQRQYLTYLDKLAFFLLSLKDESGCNIPIIFRPFQDHNGLNQYWWNSQYCTAEEYKALWKLTVNYLQDKKGVHTLLFAYSVYGNSSVNLLTDYYPGNNYVDIIGISSHLSQESDPDGDNFSETLNKDVAIITQFAEKNRKIAAVTDIGMLGVKKHNFFSKCVYPTISQHRLSYVMFGPNAWNKKDYFFIPTNGHPACEDFAQFVRQQNILTCSQLH